MKALALTPPMGWNSWNTFKKKINEDLIKETADAFVNEGFKEAGYEYVVIDDGWEAEARENGRLTWNKEKFPGGIPSLVEYVHQKGLKFGIYSCAGNLTCGGLPASYGHEEIDAKTFAEWGVDFLKYDYCYIPAGVSDRMCFTRMGQALRSTGRPILYSMACGGLTKPWEWAARAGAQMWRTAPDIRDKWESIVHIGFGKHTRFQPYAGPGHWNDPDMLVVGCGNQNESDVGCTEEEYRFHFSHWCMLAAPLMMGCDVRNQSESNKKIQLNREVISVNQDPLGIQGYMVGKIHLPWTHTQVWAKPLVDGSIAVNLLNLSTDSKINSQPVPGLDVPDSIKEKFNQRQATPTKTPRPVTIAWETLGISSNRPCHVRNLWTHEDLGEFTCEFSAKVNPHDVALLKLTPK